MFAGEFRAMPGLQTLVCRHLDCKAGNCTSCTAISAISLWECDMSPRFILLWTDEHDFYRNVRRVADGLEEAIRGVHAFLDGKAVWDEEKADAEFYEDTLTPALQALADVMAGDDLAAMLTGTRTGESAELRCENAPSSSSAAADGVGDMR